MHASHSVPLGSSVAMVVLWACATAVMPVVGFLKPHHAYPCLFFFLIGVAGTWRQYAAWQRRKAFR